MENHEGCLVSNIFESRCPSSKPIPLRLLLLTSTPLALHGKEIVLSSEIEWKHTWIGLYAVAGLRLPPCARAIGCIVLSRIISQNKAISSQLLIGKKGPRIFIGDGWIYLHVRVLCTIFQASDMPPSVLTFHRH